MNAVGLYFRYVGVSFRSQMQYRWSTILSTLGVFITLALEFAAIWGLFHRFGTLRGWTLAEVALLYGIVTVGFAMAEGVARGFDMFGNMVRMGDFDRLLLRPRPLALQVAGQELGMHRAGRAIQGAMVLGWAWTSLHLGWQWQLLGLLGLAILGTACLFYGIYILQATYCFWSIQSLEVFSVVTYGASETAQFPMSIYRPWFRRFFTFVMPLAAVTYYPALPLLGRSDGTLRTPTWFGWVSPLIGVAFLLASLWVWRFGVRHYRSTGS